MNIRRYFEKYCITQPLNIKVYLGTSRTFMAELRRRWEAFKNG